MGDPSGIRGILKQSGRNNGLPRLPSVDHDLAGIEAVMDSLCNGRGWDHLDVSREARAARSVSL